MRRAKERKGDGPKMSLLDRAISYFSPQLMLKRVAAQNMLSMFGYGEGSFGAYNGGRRQRSGTERWNPMAGDPDTDLLWDLPWLRKRSEDLARNNPIAASALNNNESNVVGTGLRLNARVNAKRLGWSDDQAKEFNEQAEFGFQLFGKRCDFYGRQPFEGLQRLTLRSTLTRGDVVALLPYKKRRGDAFGTKIQLIEADRLSNPGWKADSEKLVQGVALDDDGAPIGYHISNKHPGSITNPKGFSWTYYPEYSASGHRNVIHSFDPRRPGQHRGIPYLSPIIEKLKQLDRYTDAEIMAAVVAGCFTVFVENEAGESLKEMSPLADKEAATDKDSDDYRIEPGLIMDMQPGDRISTANPGRPNSAFDPFMNAILMQIGAALDIPFEQLIKHFKASYSAARAALLEAWRSYMLRRRWLVDTFCTPVYEAWFSEAVASGYLVAPGFHRDPFLRAAYLGAEWIGPGPGQIDPTKEVQAAVMRMENKLSTHAEECAALTGQDWDKKVPIFHQEKAALEGLSPAPPPVPTTDPEPNPNPDIEEAA